MSDSDVTIEEVRAISLLDTAIEKAMFPMIEGSEVQNLASARVRVKTLRSKLIKMIEQRDKETAASIEKQATKSAQPKQAVKKSSNGN